MTKQEFEGKNQIEQALESVNMQIEDIDSLDDDIDDDIDEGEEAGSYPDEADWFEKDPMDLAKDKFINEHMKGY